MNRGEEKISTNKMKDILKALSRRLTNLSGSNKSLLQLRLSARQDMDLHAFDFALKNTSYHIIKQLIEGKKHISLCATLDSRDDSSNILSGQLKQLFRKNKEIVEERGARDLYIGWPYVTGKLMDGTPIQCPLLFIPVNLIQTEKEWQLEQRKDVSIAFNKSFLLAYSYFNQVKLEDDFLDFTFDDFESDDQQFKNSLYNLLKESPLEINFNQELFVDKLKLFPEYTREQFLGEKQTGEIRLEPHAVLGLFPQAGSYLVPDYEYLIQKTNEEETFESFFENKIVHKAAERTSHNRDNENNYIDLVKEEYTFTPFHTDIHQENVIKAIKYGMSLVVQGPPGSGKSELICNLVSDHIARGKSVLVVCQKRAAIDVVHQRLNTAKAGDFVALIHDHKNDRKQIYQQIAAQASAVKDYRMQNSSLDAIQLERNFVDTSRKIDQLTEELEEFKKALFDESEYGISIKELYLASDPNKKFIPLKQDFKYFDYEKTLAFSRTIERISPYYLQFEKEDYVLKDRISYGHFQFSDRQHIENTFSHIAQLKKEFETTTENILGNSIDISQVEWIRDKAQLINELLNLLKDDTVFEYFKHMLSYKPDLKWLDRKTEQVINCFKDNGVEASLSTTSLGDFQVLLQHFTKSRRRIEKRLYWSLFRQKDIKKIKVVLDANQLQWNRKDRAELTQKIDNRLNLEHNLTSLKAKKWIPNDIPEIRSAKNFSLWFEQLRRSVKAVDIYQDFRLIKDAIQFESFTYESLCEKLIKLLSLCQKVSSEKSRWKTYVSEQEVNKIVNYPLIVGPMIDALQRDFDFLCEYDRLSDQLNGHEKSILKRLCDSDTSSPKALTALFQNSISLAWIEHIENKYPVLRTVSTYRMDQNEEELQNLMEDKRRLSEEILLLKLRERTYFNLEYNRLNNLVTYKDLLHQVTKKKRIWSVRKTFRSFHGEILRLVPCWLASPESVSAIFDMHGYFDLVIFDEASQCFSEKGIPAIYRGRQIMIAGDAKQLTPNDLYQVRYNEEEEQSPDLEIDSLLDLGSRYLPTISLNGHYRSNSIDLIGFSNKHFYQNKLQILPEYERARSNEPGIEYVQVHGTWQKNTNIIEAEEVVERVYKLVKSGNTNIGVVTFNYTQQALIQDLIEKYFMDKGELLPESLFVKNIENVQGDERDIIIFSVGYAPDTSGRMSMNFGSLNQEGGENRLNVAITRARSKIYVVTSILPTQLQVEKAQHKGPQLLKSYLSYAYAVSIGTYEAESAYDQNNQTKYLAAGIVALDNTIQASHYNFADLMLITLNETQLLLTDDSRYKQTLSAKEAHGYLPLLLKRKNWKHKTLFSRLYWADKEKFKGQIDLLSK